MLYGNKSIGTSATLIVSANEKRKWLKIANISSQIVYIGPDQNITTSNGFPIFEYQQFSSDKFSESYLGSIYGIVASLTSNIRYWENT